MVNSSVIAFGGANGNVSKTALTAWLYQACQIEDSLVKLEQQFNEQDITVEQLTQQATHPYIEKVPSPTFKKSDFEFLEFVQMVIGLDVILTVAMEILMWMGEKEWDLFLGLILCLPFLIIGCILLCWMEKSGCS